MRWSTHLVTDLQEMSTATNAELYETMHQRIADDFDSGRTLTLGGWMLSRSELRLYALSELAARARTRPTVEGMFPPESFRQQRFRWTCASAAFYVPVAHESLDLRLRSLAPFDQRVTVLFDGEMIDKLVLGDTVWHRFGFLLPCGAQQHLAAHASDRGQTSSPACGRAANLPFRFELRTAPTWHPANDFRSLGVQMGETPWTT